MKDLKEYFKQELNGSHSTANSKALAANIRTKKEFLALISLIDKDEPYPTPEAASWCVRYSIDQLPEFHHLIVTKFSEKLKTAERDSLIKNLLGTIKYLKIEKEHFGVLSEYCITFLTQPYRSKAVLYNSLEIMTTICKCVPELKRELYMIVDDLIPLATDAFKRKYAKTKKILG